MIQELKNQLTSLAEKSNGSFIERIKTRVSPQEVKEVVISLQDFIFAMPPLITLIWSLMNESVCPSESKRLNRILLTSLYHPFDFISNEEYGFWGYLDDAYIVGRIFLCVLNCTPYYYLHPSPEIESVVADVLIWLMTARWILPQETQEIDEMLLRLIERRTKPDTRLWYMNN